jgi:hypothetical protein
VTAGQTIKVRFDRKPTGRCPDPLTKYPGDDYSVWLYNNPVRKLDVISFDQSIKITTGIKEKAGVVDVTIPKDLPKVKDSSLWYLRVGTSLSTAPQVSFAPFFWLFVVEIFTSGLLLLLGDCMLMLSCRCPLCSTPPARSQLSRHR